MRNRPALLMDVAGVTRLRGACNDMGWDVYGTVFPKYTFSHARFFITGLKLSSRQRANTLGLLRY